MTKINQLNDTGQAIGTPAAPGLKPKKTDAFKNALDKALDTSENTKPHTAATSGLGELTPVNIKVTDKSDIVSGATDKLLGMLDSYVSKLGDPSISLKSIAPDLEKIKDNAGNLEKEASTLSDSQTPLKEIANQTVATAQAEYLKFQRGDYV